MRSPTLGGASPFQTIFAWLKIGISGVALLNTCKERLNRKITGRIKLPENLIIKPLHKVVLVNRLNKILKKVNLPSKHAPSPNKVPMPSNLMPIPHF